MKNPMKKQPTKAEAAMAASSNQNLNRRKGAPSGTKPNPANKRQGKPPFKSNEKAGFKQHLTPVNIVAVVFGLFLLIGMGYAMWPVSQTVPVQETVEEDEFGEPEQLMPVYPSGHYLASPEPMKTLANQTTEKAIRELPNFSDKGITLQTGEVLSIGTPEFEAFRKGIETQVALDLMSRFQKQVNQDSGESIILLTDPATGQFTPVTSEAISSAFEFQAQKLAAAKTAQELNKVEMIKINQAQNAIAQQPVVEKQVVVESVLSDEEKNKYIDLIETQKSENQKLRQQMQVMQEEMLQQRKQVVDVMQRIEDSPVASQRLRASMLPKQNGLKQHSIIGDRVWFEDGDGKLTTYSIGEVIDGTSLIISGTDEGSGVVLVTPR